MSLEETVAVGEGHFGRLTAKIVSQATRADSNLEAALAALRNRLV